MKTETVKIKTFNAACARAEKNELAKHGRATSRGTISQNAILIQHGAKVEEVLPDLGLLKISGDWRQAIKVAVIADRPTTKQHGAEAQHTAGKWDVIGAGNSHGGGVPTIVVHRPSKTRICTMHAPNETENAHLIAAAPDLLAALEDAEKAFTGSMHWMDALKSVRSAISRARVEN